MAAENKIGRGPWSEWSYSINTDEEAPEGKPQMVKIKQRKEKSLVVRIAKNISDTTGTFQ